MQVYPGALVDGRLIAAYQHLAVAAGADPQTAVAAVAARCQQLLEAMTPLPDDLKALAADPWTEQDDRWYYVALAQHYGLVSACEMPSLNGIPPVVMREYRQYRASQTARVPL